MNCNSPSSTLQFPAGSPPTGQVTRPFDANDAIAAASGQSSHSMNRQDDPAMCDRCNGSPSLTSCSVGRSPTATVCSPIRSVASSICFCEMSQEVNTSNIPIKRISTPANRMIPITCAGKPNLHSKLMHHLSPAGPDPCRFGVCAGSRRGRPGAADGTSSRSSRCSPRQ